MIECQFEHALVRPLLLLGESPDRGCAGGAAGWQQAGEERDGGDHGGGAGEDRGTVGGHMEQNGAHGLPRDPGADHAEDCAGGEQARREPEELAADLLGSAPECHAHADLAAALGDGVTEDAVGADARSAATRSGESAGQHGGRPAGDEAFGDAVVHGLDVGDGEFGIDAADDCFSRVAAEGFGLDGGAHDYEDVGVGAIDVRDSRPRPGPRPQ